VADATTDADAAAATTARDNAVAARNDAAQALSAVVASAGPTVPLGELLFVAAMPARVQAGVTSLGPLSQVAAGVNGGPTAASLVTLAAGDLLVTATIPSDQASLVRPTMAVDLTDNVTGTAYPASITSIADTPTIDATGGSGLQATIRPIAPLPASLTGANVRVTITAASSDGAVLVVPLAAVSAAADGRQRVSVMASGGDLADVFVRAGLSADGFVEVHPDHADELKAGDQVVVGR
jgi:hypothetical protein